MAISLHVNTMKILTAALLVFVVPLCCHHYHHNNPSHSYNLEPRVMKPYGRSSLVSLGPFQSLLSELENELKAAGEDVHRHFSHASPYENEKTFRKVLKEWISSGNGRREDIFITTKLPYFGMRPGVKQYMGKSLKKLQMKYEDMFLIHSPFGTADVDESKRPSVLDKSTDSVALWKANTSFLLIVA